MLKFALIGAGRIGRMHGSIIASHNKTELIWVYDILEDNAITTANTTQARVAKSLDEIFEDDSLDVVLIASSTETHAELIVRAAKAGKAVFCEKPIDLDIKRVDWCREQIQGLQVPIQIGFNRRFDPSHRKVADTARDGGIGKLEQMIITSRDPNPPPKEYYLASGGMFRDMTIHDFDMARYVLNEEVETVMAMSATLFDPVAKEIDEMDSAMILLQTASGKMCHINNSRHATYGYDQRVEAHGSLGMIRSENQHQHSTETFGAESSSSRAPLHFFFIERYRQAYLDQFDAFIESIENQQQPLVGFEDGRRALMLANAAYQSLEKGQAVKVEYGE